MIGLGLVDIQEVVEGLVLGVWCLVFVGAGFIIVIYFCLWRVLVEL